MNIFRAILISFLFLISFSQSIFAIDQGNIQFNFVDSQSGIRITPSSLIISNILTKENIYFSSEVLRKGKIEKNIPYGNYSLIINSNGYTQLNTNINISKTEIAYNIYLDPVISNYKLDTGRIQKLHTSDSQLYCGYIVDTESLLPIQGVEINYTPKNKKFYTDNNGYFEFSLPAECGGNKYTDLVFKKSGYKIQTDQNIENYPNNDVILHVKLAKGSGSINIDEKNFRSRVDEVNLNSGSCQDCNENSEKDPDFLFDTFVIPQNIKVGRSCTGTNCSTVEIYTIDTYCKYVIPAEVYGCWGSLAGGMNSLQAFATAVRTYALYFVYHPISSTYDICDNTYCQMLGSSQNTYSNTAVDNSTRYVLLNSSGNIVRSEYAAENNNLGCGNGFSGTGSAWPCISDLVCSGTTANGHGRGLCQWGSIRWATGTKVLTGSPCSLGVSHGYGTKTWQEILDHYYNVTGYNWTLNQGGTSKILSNSSIPNIIPACGNVSLQFNLNTTSNLNLFLAASIAPTGTSNYISDPAHDVKVNISAGTGNYNRQFTVPCSTPPGVYDLLTALWYDKNNNNVIDAGDLVIDSKLTTHALTVQPSSGVNIISTEIPDKYLLHPNYPNPFNPTTKIVFDVRKTSQVKVYISDISGKIVADVSNGEMKAGRYEFIWNAENLPNGIYFCRMESENYSGTVKLVLVK